MKKRVLVPFILFVMLMVSVSSVKAADVLYATAGGVRVFAEKSTSSKVIKTCSKGEQLLVEELGSSWSSVLVEDPRGGQMLGWVRMEYMSINHIPSNICHHQWTDWTVTTEPTCTSGGMMMRSCPICGVGEAKDMEPLGHSYGDWRVTRQATCTSEGEKVRSCVRCGREQYQTIEKAAHSYGDWKVTRQATCTSEGQRVRSCTVCGAEERQTVEKLPHSYGNWKVTKEATCAAEGSREHTCVNCGYTGTETIEKLPHDFESRILKEPTDHSSGVRTNVCKNCGYTEEEVSFDPEGTLRRGDRSEEVREMQRLLADQNYLNYDGADGIFGGGTEIAVMTFQKDRGLTPDGVCWPQTMQKLRHEFGEWEMIKDLERDAAGERRRVCRECGYEQHETVEPEPGMERGRRGEDVRAFQQMLTTLGFDAGSFDGIYGQKLDNAFELFAKAQNLEFTPGSLNALQIDSLVNSWIASVPEEEWSGNGNNETPVNLALTVTPVEEESDDAILTYSWSLTNLGSESCIFTTLLMNPDATSDFRSGNFVMALDGEELLPRCGNSVSGSFRVSRSWSETPGFAALAVSDSSGAKWLSNIQ